MQAAGVAGGKVGSPRVRRPMLNGWKQSTSLSTSMELMTTESETCAGKGRSGRMPDTAGSALRLVHHRDDRRFGGVGRKGLVAIAQAHLAAELLHRAAVHAGAEVVAHHEGGDARAGAGRLAALPVRPASSARTSAAMALPSMIFAATHASCSSRCREPVRSCCR